ncbi:MAG: Hsp20/alpha crystallin family protein [Chitinispirillales bacterium]|jgi:HSP20 family protein|nr:Hsp20/alpha crystallin family protein [Chitinispirillales bacterium]
MSAFVMRNYPAAMLSNWLDGVLDNQLLNADREMQRVMQPRMDFSEEDAHYLIKADVPGLSKEDINITVENGIIKIEGESKEERKGKYHHVERLYGRFSRSFSLPDEVDAGKIEAKVNKGVLELKLPKTEKTKAIEIKVC